MTTAMISNAEFFAQRNLVDYLREVPFNVTPPGLYCAPSLYGEMMKDCQCKAYGR